MIDLVDINLSIMDKMEDIRKKANDNTNAKTFCSAYIWSGPMNIKVHLENDMYVIKNNSHGKTAWNFPVGEERAKLGFIDKLIGIEGLRLLKLTEEDVVFLKMYYPNEFYFEEAEEDSEYIYDAEEHAMMAGKTFASLRKLLNKFDRLHSTETVMLGKHNMHTAEAIMLLWGDTHEARGELNTLGTEADLFIMEHYEEIGMIGVLINIDGVPSAVAMGYPISNDVCDIAVIKSIPTIKDAGYVAMEEFMRMFRGTYRYFNNEEDMGISGLREYKRCLKPCRMNVLWNAYLIGGK